MILHCECIRNNSTCIRYTTDSPTVTTCKGGMSLTGKGRRKHSLRYKHNTLVLASLRRVDAVEVKTSFRKPRPPPSFLATARVVFRSMNDMQPDHLYWPEIAHLTTLYVVSCSIVDNSTDLTSSIPEKLFSVNGDKRFFSPTAKNESLVFSPVSCYTLTGKQPAFLADHPRSN